MKLIGKTALRQVNSVKLSRYASYLIVQNADPSKEIVAQGQTYFAVRTRIQEISQRDEYTNLPTENERGLFLRNELATAQYSIGCGRKGIRRGYDGGGERVLKSSSYPTIVHENGTPINSGGVVFDSYTTYPSPLIVIKGNGEYTKHYFNGSQRVVSRIGDEGVDYFNVPDPFAFKEIQNAQIADLQKIAYKAGRGTVSFKEYKPIESDTVKIQVMEAEPDLHRTQPGFTFYYHPDHLGTGTFITDLAGQPYQFFLNLPFGETMAEQRNTNSPDDYDNRYKFNGKELDEETGLYYYGARYYNPNISIWLSVDPLAEVMPSWSPYSFVFNNPINFIDPDGRIPYPITIRSFAPFKTFGYGFHGDNRGYTTSSATARVHQVINFDTDKSKISARAWSSSTSHSFLPGSATETPSVGFTDGLKTRTSGDSKTFMFGTHSKGANPMVPGSPNIDVFSDFSITENKKAGTLDISGTLTGDNFPSTEAFISDPSGQNLFLGIGQIGVGVGKNTGPMTELFGENRDRSINSFNFSVTTDKKGNFTGVRMGDTNYSVEDWNKRFTSQSTQQQ